MPSEINPAPVTKMLTISLLIQPHQLLKCSQYHIWYSRTRCFRKLNKNLPGFIRIPHILKGIFLDFLLDSVKLFFDCLFREIPVISTLEAPSPTKSSVERSEIFWAQLDLVPDRMLAWQFRMLFQNFFWNFFGGLVVLVLFQIFFFQPFIGLTDKH